ncbi:helix-turn-helix domain-containing protein [Verminephrobacter eiseniae]|nr:helix-turn-helix domain-containing protein [Verminephrobacter eiseniae]
MKYKRNFKALEKRRLRGAQLLSQGKSQSAVARELGVARQTVATWAHRLAEGGKRSLKRAPSNATSRRLLGESDMAGLRSKKSPARRPQHRLHRRIRLERTAQRCAHLEPAWTDTDSSAQLHLETTLGHRCAVFAAVLLSLRRRVPCRPG